jgi:hypothetical protein
VLAALLDCQQAVAGSKACRGLANNAGGRLDSDPPDEMRSTRQPSGVCSEHQNRF